MRTVQRLFLFVLPALLLVACGAPRGAPTESISPEMPAEEAPLRNLAARGESAGLPAPAPTMAPMPAPAEYPAPAAEAAPAKMADVQSDLSLVNNDAVRTSAGPAGVERMIIKNADFDIKVENTDVAVDRLTALAVSTGGYLISSRVHEDGGFKIATVQFAVPAENFEQALRQVRQLALAVNSESVSGQDVSEEFVDLQARIRNLEATAARIRGFLDQAKTTEEALQVNNRLTQVEEEIEQLKGRANFLEQRAAFSMITVFAQPERPTPTPTPTPTPVAPPVWDPGHTAGAAGNRLLIAAQGLADALIWLLVFWVPILLPFVAVFLLGVAIYRRVRRLPTT